MIVLDFLKKLVTDYGVRTAFIASLLAILAALAKLIGVPVPVVPGV